MRIGEYEIGEKLGEGGMSEVYAATHVRLGSRHALKLFAYPKEGADEIRARFEQEGRLLARLRHPRVVRVTDFGTDAATGRPYFVMDLVVAPEGAPRSLADVPAGEADEETIGRWYDDLRAGLAYIHNQGIIHRDLKLENVLVGPDGHVVLTDFGISRVLATNDGAPAVSDPVRTLVRVKDGKAPLMGSIGYLAPELELGAAATAKSDWYALGVLVYRLLTGTWCDARTDVVGTLATYDPVWSALIPKLLHANPEGRECLSYAEEKARAQDACDIAHERKLDALQARLRGRGLLVAGLSVLLAAGLGPLSLYYERDALLCLELAAEQSRPTIERVFTRPSDMEEEDFLSAAADVLSETFGDFRGYQTGKISLETLVDRLESKRNDLLTEDDELVLEKVIENLRARLR